MEGRYELRFWGRSYNPSNWFFSPYYMVNRIYYICGGSARFRESKTLKKGYAYIFPASPEFAVSQDPKDPVDHVFFDFFSHRKIDADDCTEVDISSMYSLRHIFLAAMEDFRSEPKSHATGQAYFTLISSLLHPYLRSSDYGPVTAQVIKYIHELDVKDLTVNRLAEHVCVNVNHMIRCFRKDTGMTPHKYIAVYKADLATSMISHGASITEAALETGFGSVSAFSAFYKKERHIPPSMIEADSGP